jgi:hypothetical protein
MPEMRMNSLKSLAMNWGPLSEMIRGLAHGYRSFARSRMISMSASVFRPAPDEIHDLVPRIVRNPNPGQSSPTLFFKGKMLQTRPLTLVDCCNGWP